VENFGGAQQRLGRDAAQFRQNAAEMIFDDRGLEAALRGADRRDVAARPEPMMMMSKDVSGHGYTLVLIVNRMDYSFRIARSSRQNSGGNLRMWGRRSSLPVVEMDWLRCARMTVTPHTIIIGVFDQHLEGAISSGAERAVDRAVIARQVTLMMCAASILPSRTTARCSLVPTARIVACGWIDHGGKSLMPYMPSWIPPVCRPDTLPLQLRARARAAKSFISAESSTGFCLACG